YVFQFDPCQKLQIGVGGQSPACVQSGTGTPSNPSISGQSQTSSTKYTNDSVAKIILGPMQILARQTTTYTIRVDAALAERLAYTQAAGGQLQLLLRAPGDDRAISTQGATFGAVYTQFKFPLPEKILVTP